MNEWKKLLRDLSRGVNVDKNLPRYAEVFVDTCYHEALLKLTFSAYLLYEQKEDGVGNGVWDSPDEAKWYGETASLLRRLVEQADKPFCAEVYEDLAEQANQLRGQMKAVMEVYTTYADRLICFDHVIDRMRFRYEGEEEQRRQMNDINEVHFVNHVMQFLFEPDDSAVRAERIKNVIREIPVLMTKNKLFSHIEQTLSAYVGGDKTSLERYLYILRSVAMLNQPDESVISKNQIGTWIDQLSHTDFLALDEAGFLEMKTRMDQEADRLSQMTDLYVQLQEIVNEIYAFCLIRRYTQNKTDLYTDCMDVLRDVTESHFQDEKLEKLEGKIEYYVETAAYLESFLPEIKKWDPDRADKWRHGMDLHVFTMISDLLSDSLFIDLKKGDDTEFVDERMVNEAVGQLTDQLSQLFKTLPKEAKRTVMSMILAELPPIFQNAEECVTYVTTNVFGCQNMAERKAVVSSLASLMAEEELFDVEWSDPDDLLV